MAWKIEDSHDIENIPGGQRSAREFLRRLAPWRSPNWLVTTV